jgi:hypothetical protein
MTNELKKVFEQYTYIDSTVINAAATCDGDLYVKFKTTGDWYMVENAADRYAELVIADSPNGWYHRNIKSNYRVFKLYAIFEDTDAPALKVFNLQQC